MKAVFGNTTKEVELTNNNEIIIRENGMMLKAIRVKNTDGVERFKEVVKRLEKVVGLTVKYV